VSHKADRYELFLVHHNLLYPDTPRVFIAKMSKASKVLWAYEIDEIEERILNTEFLQEEAEFFGVITRFEENVATIEVEGHSKDFDFPPKLGWSLETLMTSTRGLSTHNGVVHILKPTTRDKYAEDEKCVQSEKDHIARLAGAHFKEIEKRAPPSAPTKEKNNWTPVTRDTSYEEKEKEPSYDSERVHRNKSKKKMSSGGRK